MAVKKLKKGDIVSEYGSPYIVQRVFSSTSGELTSYVNSLGKWMTVYYEAPDMAKMKRLPLKKVSKIYQEKAKSLR